MSKKMMKRSLALGALMAFVITGSAMAATTLTDENTVTGVMQVSGIHNSESGQCGAKEKIWNLADKELWITSNAGCAHAKDYAVWAERFSFTGEEGSTLRIAASEGNSITYGLAFSGNVDVDNLIIETSSSAILSYGNMSIDANSIQLTAKNDGHGIFIASDGNGETTVDSESLTINAASDGIRNHGGSSCGLTVSSNVINVTANGNGVESSNEATTTIIGSDIDITSGSDAIAINRSSTVNKVGKISINGDDVNIKSTSGHAISADISRINNNDETPLVDIKSTGDITITAENSSKNAIYTRLRNPSSATKNISVNIEAGGDLDINGTVKIMDTKENSVLKGDNVSIESKGIALDVQTSWVDVIANESIEVKSTTSYGIHADYLAGEGLNLDASKITVEGVKGAIFAQVGNANGSPKVILTADEINVTGDIDVTTNNALVTLGNGDRNGADYVANVNGNVSNVNGSTINIDLGTDGSLTGKVTDDNTTAGKGVNLDLGTGSTWNVTGESNVSTLSGSGTIAVTNLETGVTVATNKTGDITVVTSSDNLGSDTAASMETLSSLVACGEEGIADKLVFTAGKYYDDVTANVTDEGIVITKDKTINEANLNVSDAAALGMMSWRAEMNDMNKRMGELRNAHGDLGVWVRMVRGEDEYNNVKTQYNQYQLGYDEKLSVDERWTVGMALSYTDGETTFAKGNGENTNKALSVYGSKLNADGTFVDLIAKYARLENEFNVTGGIGGGEYSTNGYSVSAEFGKRIQQGNGLWIEPQAELSYGKVSAVDYVTKNGVNVAQDGMESIVGRVGFSIGKDIEKGNVYARASYLYDFDGETSVNLDGRETLEQDLGGGWWEVGVGANINLSKATYIYADVEKTFGGEVDTNWQWNLGVRYSF